MSADGDESAEIVPEQACRKAQIGVCGFCLLADGQSVERRAGHLVVGPEAVVRRSADDDFRIAERQERHDRQPLVPPTLSRTHWRPSLLVRREPLFVGLNPVCRCMRLLLGRRRDCGETRRATCAD